jgi:aminoglycoside phosphotransferase
VNASGSAAVARRVEAPSASVRSLREYVTRSGLREVVIGASKDPNAKILVLLVRPDSGDPVVAVKVPTTDVAARVVEAEMTVLRHLARTGDPELLETIPRLVDVVVHDGRRAAVTTALGGTPMTALYYRRRHTGSERHAAADFAAAEAWLARFQAATAQRPTALELGGEAVVDRLLGRFGGDRVIRSDAARLQAIHDALRAETTTASAVHGDLWFGNVIVRGGRFSGVVDWEAGSTTGEPVRDIVRFALLYALYLDRRTRAGRRVRGQGFRANGWGAGVDHALDGVGWFPALFETFVRRGLARVGASPEVWRLAVLAGICEFAATTDHDGFARLQLELFRRLPDRRPLSRPSV